MTYKTELTIVMYLFSLRAGQLDLIFFSIGLVEKFHWYQVIVELYRSQMRTKVVQIFSNDILLPLPLKMYCSIDV